MVPSNPHPCASKSVGHVRKVSLAQNISRKLGRRARASRPPPAGQHTLQRASCPTSTAGFALSCCAASDETPSLLRTNLGFPRQLVQPTSCCLRRHFGNSKILPQARECEFVQLRFCKIGNPSASFQPKTKSSATSTQRQLLASYAKIFCFGDNGKSGSCKKPYDHRLMSCRSAKTHFPSLCDQTLEVYFEKKPNRAILN